MMYFPQSNLGGHAGGSATQASISEMAHRQPTIPNSINRLNLKSAHPASNDHNFGVADMDIGDTGQLEMSAKDGS